MNPGAKSPGTIPDTWAAHDRKVKPYHRAGRLIGWGERLLLWSVFAYLLWNQRFYALEIQLQQNVPGEYARWLLYFGGLSLAWSLLSLPLDSMAYWVERKYELSRQTYGAWFWDKIKGLLVGGVLGGLALGLFFVAIQYGGSSWWWLAATLLVLFSVVLAQLAPVVLIPIFMKLEPMEASPLKERLLKLCERFQINVKEVYHLGLGEKTEKGNAAFMGLGKTKRIVIGDTLYKKFSADEVEAVFAHELGHQVHNDLWKGLAVSTAFIYLSFFAAKCVLEAWVFPHAFTSIQSAYGVLLFFAVLSVIQIPIGVIQAAYSRQREREADRFAAEKIGCSPQLADALEKLTIQNWGEFVPNPLREWWGYSHPAPYRRIQKLRS